VEDRLTAIEKEDRIEQLLAEIKLRNPGSTPAS
jgi:hypothetical protein